MHQVLLNLTVNARDAMPSGGTLEVAIAIVDPPENVGELPVRASRASVTARAPAGDADELGGSETLLVVEDDPGVCATLCAVLTVIVSRREPPNPGGSDEEDEARAWRDGAGPRDRGLGESNNGVACVLAADCTDPLLPFCSQDNDCVQCLEHQDCPQGQQCNNNVCE